MCIAGEREEWSGDERKGIDRKGDEVAFGQRVKRQACWQLISHSSLSPWDPVVFHIDFFGFVWVRWFLRQLSCMGFHCLNNNWHIFWPWVPRVLPFAFFFQIEMWNIAVAFVLPLETLGGPWISFVTSEYWNCWADGSWLEIIKNREKPAMNYGCQEILPLFCIK